MEPIAHIHTDMPQKFGIPRNSLVAPHLHGRIVLEPEFSTNLAVTGLDGFSHIWLLWQFENRVPGGHGRRHRRRCRRRVRSRCRCGF
ncbi:MAG: TrmO family methyltransferase [Senegalimassilia faecalis]